VTDNGRKYIIYRYFESRYGKGPASINLKCEGYKKEKVVV